MTAVERLGSGDREKQQGYEAPRIAVLGTVRELTQGPQNGPPVDAMNHSR
jgi:hypothetical protein